MSLKKPMFKKPIYFYFFAVVLFFALWFGLAQCVRRQNQRNKQEFISELKQNETNKTIIDLNNKQIIERSRVDKNGNVSAGHGNRETVTDFSGARRVAITVTDDGKVKIYAPTKGFILEPGISASYSEDRPRLGLDVQVAYLGRWGLNLGLALPVQRPLTLRAYIAGSYTLPFRSFGNTSVFLGITQTKQAVFGLRLKF